MTEARSASGRKVVLGAGSAVVVMLTGAYLAFSVLGRGRFERGSRMTEAHSHVALLARGVAECTRARPALPPSSTWRGGSGESAASYVDEAFRCAKFAPGDAQTFQYRWESLSPTTGAAHARGDLDGDGHAETGFLVKLACEPGEGGLQCAVGPVDPVAIAPPR